MASEGGPEAEFHDSRRQQLLETLKRALNVDTISSPTVWACLWLSDIDRLQQLIPQSKRESDFTLSVFRDIENSGKIVQKCEFIKLIFNMDC